MWPPEWPGDWLDWLTLVGAILGILSAIKLFASNLWLNRFQRVALVAAEQACTKDIHIIKPMGGSVVFHLATKDNEWKISNDFYNHINKVCGDTVGQSRANLIYLDELVRKGSFVHIIEQSSIEGMKDESYAITAKGLRYAKILKLFVHPPDNTDKLGQQDQS